MKTIRGKVISKPAEKTLKVEVQRVIVHPLYKKRFKRTKNYLVHDIAGSDIGDEIIFVTSRPFSKRKRWVTVAEKVEKTRKRKTKK